MVDGKEWYKSKTVWVGVIVTLIAVLQLVASLLTQEQVAATDITLLFVGILQVILRVWFTDTPIIRGGNGSANG